MKNINEKIEIKESVPLYIDMYDLEGDTKKIIKFLENIPNKIKDWADNLPYKKDEYPSEVIESNNKLLSCHRYELKISGGYDDFYLSIEGYRWETDEEFNTRLEKQKQDKLKAQKAAKTRKLKQEEKFRKGKQSW